MSPKWVSQAKSKVLASPLEALVKSFHSNAFSASRGYLYSLACGSTENISQFS